MSDKDNDQAVAEAADEESPSNEAAAPEEVTPEPDVARDKPSSGSSNSIAWLAFLVAIVALASAGYTAWQNWQAGADTTAEDRVARLESRLSSSERSLADLLEQVNALGQREDGVELALRVAVDGAGVEPADHIGAIRHRRLHQRQRAGAAQ